MSPPDVDTVDLVVDGRAVSVPQGATILDACRALSIDVPTLCWASNLTPASVCRVCVVEVRGARVLVPSCGRVAEPGMVVETDSPRVRQARRTVLELLSSSADLSHAPEFAQMCERYGARPDRFVEHRASYPPPRVDNALYVRDLSRCILCTKCVQACGEDAQFTFAITVAGAGGHASIATEFDGALPDSACVYCGNCVGVCPTGALVARTEFDLRQSGAWDPSRQHTTDTICPYCGVGCTLTLHVQDGAIVKVTSPADGVVTHGSLCVKGRFGFAFVRPQTG